jgi:uncharacterized protein YecE (DUF72 family)
MPRAAFFLGSCSWVDDHWRGGFYPPHLPQHDWLPFYASQFNAVEVDSTFYAVPRREVVQRWHDVTPPAFRFTLKLPKALTHDRHLDGADLALPPFLKAIEPLGEKLGAVLVQLPPSFVPGRDHRALKQFLQQIPAGLPVAIEFRDPGWNTQRYRTELHSRGVTLVWNDLTAPGGRDALTLRDVPEGFAYVRLLGDIAAKYDAKGGHLHVYDRVQWPRERDLDAWAEKLLSTATRVDRIFVMANNHFEGFAPHTLRALRQRLGLPEPPPPPPHGANPRQPDLFPI